MSESVANSYDAVIYDSRPRTATHPDCLATVARLHGLSPAPVDRCRVLELGCATGGNLLPMAESLPESQFLGIDLSARQIDLGRQVVSLLGLNNLQLEARNLLSLDASLGTFDYIIAHGVYSWVSAPVRDHLLKLCRTLLAPHGVAYVSYNTYPGWHLRAPARELMAFHTATTTDPSERVRQAREVLHFFAEHALAPQSAYARLLRDEAELVRREGDYYVFHEHLEDDNYPVYFHQFLSHASQHGLQYLGEAQNNCGLAVLPTDVRQELLRLAPDPLQREQYLDFFHQRSFRRTLLVAQEVPVQRQPDARTVEQLLLLGMARPTNPDADPASEESLEFHNDDNAAVDVAHPLLKAALLVLFENWPRAFSFKELLFAIHQRLGDFGGLTLTQARGLLCQSMVSLYQSNLVGLHTHLPDFVLQVSHRPRTTPLIRLQAATGAQVTNRRFRLLELSVFDRTVLSLLDGQRDRATLLEELSQRVARGELGLSRDGKALEDWSKVREALQEELEPSLQRLAQAMVLVK
jgi:methyltransferase-like protein/cyclopropane fatty-acyl-phospholipid synthase-like methyltransferase